MANNDKSEPKEKSEIQNNENSSRINLAILGGFVGAGIGLLSNPGTGKKVLSSIGQSEAVRVAGKELRRTAQEVITDQAIIQIRKTAAGYLEKGRGNLITSKILKADDDQAAANTGPENELSTKYKELKEENKQLKDHLSKIDEKLNQLLDSKK
ncbi:GvpT/GvpP family gas vesicle accessory protein [Falsibacillus albus]|uniref:Gas vesicle protein GvpP n=1 Tax=Falsibacillus albus TaxID=2478915 RepID=A0A3L7JY76_9BACI|nr:GvpT/GvpP family gas vesicle accessory protein [Falsibacillus albus]RLQ95480.1 gas vesicle protein GvpP [Falsibacillus albus]